MRQVVVHMVHIVPAPDGLAGEREGLVAELCAALDLGERAVEVARRDGGHGHHLLRPGAELLPGPVVPHPALRIGEHRVRRRPHGEALVREDDLGVDAVALIVADAPFGVGAGLRAHPVLALEAHDPDAVRPVALAIAPLHAVLVGDDAGRALAVFLRQARGPQVRRLVGVAVGRDHVVFLRVAGARGARPAFVARRFQPPEVLGIDGDIVHGLPDTPSDGRSRRTLPARPGGVHTGPPVSGAPADPAMSCCATDFVVSTPPLVAPAKAGAHPRFPMPPQAVKRRTDRPRPPREPGMGPGSRPGRRMECATGDVQCEAAEDRCANPAGPAKAQAVDYAGQSLVAA